MLDPKKLRMLERRFLVAYPGGFDHPEMIKIGKKHKMDAMHQLTRNSFAKNVFNNSEAIAESFVNVISRSSMVSMFEKPKLRDFIRVLNDADKGYLSSALQQLLHGKQAQGFTSLVDILKTGKLAKWSLLTIVPAYMRPEKEVFVKPTTAKDIIGFFALENLVYKPTPSWDFYTTFRQLINEAKKEVDASLSPSNAAFTGFLMMSMQPQ